MPYRRWLITLVALGAALLYGVLRRGAFRQVAANVHAFDLPSARLYDRLVTPVAGRFYSHVADEVAAACPAGRILEIGSGPGRLAVRLGQLVPNATVTGVDLAPSMVELANRGAAGAGLGDRVRFEVGDVAALPFPDASFDCVVSTLSFHHWTEPAEGLAEIHRVLKPGGTAHIYDLAPGLLQVLHGTGADLHRLAAASPFGGQSAEVLPVPGRLRLLVRLRLRRGEAAGSEMMRDT